MSKSNLWIDLETAGTTGSEKGIIILDEEYSGACRITLERCKNYYAITCGVYGGMVHTAFCAAENANKVYDQMKSELQEFIDKETTDEEETAFYKYFTRKY